MRIALLHSRYARTGGVEKYVAGLADRLIASGEEVHYFSRRPDRDRPPPALRIHPVPVPRWPEALKPLAFAYLTRSELRRAAPPFDVVHGFSSTFEQDIYTDGSGPAAELPLARGPATGPSPGARWKRFGPRRLVALHLEARRFAAPGLRRVLAMSRLVESGLLRHHSLPPGRIQVLRPPVELEEFHPRDRDRFRRSTRVFLSTPEASPVVLFVGNGFARKGLDLLIEALARDPGAGWVLWVLGRDRQSRRFQALARRRQVEARFIGFSPQVVPFYAAADVFVLPSRFDAFGAAALEAMAAGLPVVVSAHAGASEILEDGKSGLILRSLPHLEEEAPEELAGHLRHLSDRSLRERLGAGARRTAERASWEAHLAGVLLAYREAAGR